MINLIKYLNTEMVHIYLPINMINLKSLQIFKGDGGLNYEGVNFLLKSSIVQFHPYNAVGFKVCLHLECTTN